MHRAEQVGTERFARELGDYDLTDRQLLLLKAIAANDGASQTTAVNITGTDLSTLAEVVKRLMKRRLIARKRSTRVARAHELTLSDERNKTVAHVEPIQKAVEKQMLTNIRPKQRADMLAMLEALATVRCVLKNARALQR